jgi:23S rRNA U2552 (ribose-2'-O)-methylase RlmE/FtsJ
VFENQSVAEALITALPDIITPELGDKPLTVLDFGLAPGGFARTILSFNQDPATRYYGITLPCSPGVGGLRVVVTDPSTFTVTNELGDMHIIGENRIFWLEQDITMFALEFGVAENAGCLTNHPSAAEFIMDRPYLDLTGKVDLVIADCVVMNAHFRAEWREDKRKETIRVNVAQLILGLRRLRPGGTIVMKLYKIQDFETILLLQKLDAIGQLSVWKSAEHPATGADFFAVLRGVRIGTAEVQQVLLSLKAVWWKATFGVGGLDGLVGESGAEPERADVERVLRVWGDRFLELGGDVWSVLCGVLARAAGVANPLDESDEDEDEEHMVDL